MYSTQFNGDVAMLSSADGLALPNKYEQKLQNLENVFSNIDKKLNELEKRLNQVTSDRSRILANEKRFHSSTSMKDESWSQIVAYSTTIHGLKDVLIETRPAVKILWVILFVSAVAAMIYYNVTVAKEYLNDPTATQVRILRQEQYDFPVMLLCPDTWLDAKKATSKGLSLLALQYALTYLINYEVTPSTYTFQGNNEYSKAEEDFHKWYYNKSNNITNLAEFFKAVALDSADFVVKCSFCKESNGIHPFSSYFQKVIMNEAVCYNLSLGPTDGRVALGDLDFLVVNVPDKTMGLLRTQSYWRLFINPDLSIGMSDTHYVKAFPFHANTVRVMPRRFKSAAVKSSDCYLTERANEMNYTQATCVADCVSGSHELTNSASPCTPLILCRSESVPWNLSYLCQSYPTLMPVHDPTLLVETPKRCVELCPPLCDKWIYESTVEAHRIIDNRTFNSFPPESMDSTVYDKDHLTEFYFLNEVIHYGGVLLFEEVATYSFETMISNFGGQLGLWLGASIVSMIQLLMLLTNFCFEKRKQASMRSQSNTN